MSLSQIEVVPLTANVDDRGCLTEIWRQDWFYMRSGHTPNSVKQVYVVESFSKGTIRGFHKHEALTDDFIIVSGSAKFVLFKRTETPNEKTGQVEFCYPQPKVVVTSARKLTLVRVPPPWFHGWMALEDNTVLVSCADMLYKGWEKKGELDEERIPYDTLNIVLGRDVWAVEFK